MVIAILGACDLHSGVQNLPKANKYHYGQLANNFSKNKLFLIIRKMLADVYDICIPTMNTNQLKPTPWAKT
jgi:hypothetical protein